MLQARYSFSTRCCSLERSAHRSRGWGAQEEEEELFISAVHLARLEFVDPLSTLLLVTLFILLAILAKLGELLAPQSRVYVGDLVCDIADCRCLVWHHRFMHLVSNNIPESW